MLERIGNLPGNVIGVRAKGKVTKRDYDEVLIPELTKAKEQGHRVRLLYEMGPDFKGLTPTGALADTLLTFRFMRVFERFAMVTDIEWFRNTVRLFSPLVPYLARNFGNSDEANAVSWVSSSVLDTDVPHRIFKEAGVLIVEPNGPLSREDFEALSHEIKAWVKHHDKLNGLIIHTRHFPGWENVGSFIAHVDFVLDHHRTIGRIAISTDIPIAGFVAMVGKVLIDSEMKSFAYDSFEDAVKWAGGSVRPKTKKVARNQSAKA